MAAKKGYDWSIGSPPPEIGIHSLSKHRVYTQYLQHYISVINAYPAIDTCRLSIIDGFAGGGLYTHPLDHTEYLGSPVQLIQAAESAIKEVNLRRQEQGVRTPLTNALEYYFFEKKRCNFEYLRHFLQEYGLKHRLSRDIHLQQGELIDYIDGLIQILKNKGRAHRCIFVLDQYGYKEVPLFVLNKIFSSLQNAEVILTFSVDALINYMSNQPEFIKTMRDTGFLEVMDIDSLLSLKQESPEWKFFVQTLLLNGIHQKSGASFYTPFFIRSNESNRSFWLIHLSNHPRARDVMTQLHWEISNQFVHYAGCGLQMLGYDPTSDQSLTQIEDLFSGTEYSFDEAAKSRTLDALVNEIPRCIENLKTPIAFNEFFKIVTNHTPATAFLIKEAMEDMVSKDQLVIKSEESQYRKKATTIKNNDLIMLPDQVTFSFSNNTYQKHR